MRESRQTRALGNLLNLSCFRYWLCAATGPTIKIWDLESKNMVEELRPEVRQPKFNGGFK